MNATNYPTAPCRTTPVLGTGCGKCATCARTAEALKELQRALAQVQPPVIDEVGRPSHRDRSACMCQVSPRVVSWLIEELQHEPETQA